MGLLLYDNNYVSSFSTWELVGLTVEGVSLSIRCSFVDFGFNDLLLLDNLLAIAVLALILLVDHFALATAVIARTGRLSVHTGSKLLHFGYLATTSASATLLNGTFFTAETSARLADSLAIDCDLCLLAHVDLLEGHLEWVLHWLHFLGTSILLSAATSHAEHLSEDVVHTSSATTAAFFETLLTILVVSVAFLLVRKHFIGSLELLESVFVATTIGVILEGQFAESLLDLVH